MKPTCVVVGSGVDRVERSTPKVLRWDGTRWRGHFGVTAETLYGVWGASDSDVWAVGSGGVLAHFDGLTWSSHALESDSDWHNSLYALSSRASGGLAAVGAGGLMYRLTAAGWRRITQGRLALLPFRIQLSTLAADEGDTVYAGGFRYGGGYIMARGTDGWTPRGSYRVVDMSIDETGRLWAVSGWRSKIHSLENGLWRSWDSLNNADLYGIAAISHDDVWAVGDDYTQRWDGEQWLPIPNFLSGTDANLFTVAGSGSSDVWAGGADGTLLHWNGTTWTAIASGTNANIDDISASHVNFAVAAAGEQILMWDGDAWASVTLDASYVGDVWASSPQQAWAVAGPYANRGDVWQWDGVSWIRSAAPGGLIAIDGTSEGVWVLREDGGVLYRPTP